MDLNKIKRTGGKIKLLALLLLFNALIYGQIASAVVRYAPSAGLGTGTVRSSHIKDGDLVNADISTTANIAHTKLVIDGAQGDILIADGTRATTTGVLSVATSTSAVTVTGTVDVSSTVTASAYTADDSTATSTFPAIEFNTSGRGITFFDGSIQLTAGAGSATTTTWISSGTYTKSTGVKKVFVQAWGGGGAGGGKTASNQVSGAGGGGGGYSDGWFDPNDLGATETITIGAGGVGVLADTGGDGGNTTFGSLLTAYGGGGGGDSNVDVAGGGGGGLFSKGSPALSGTGGDGGAPIGGDGGAASVGGDGQFGGAGGGDSSAGGGNSVYGGGGGGSNSVNSPGGNSVYGGGGGGGGRGDGGASGAGGTSALGGDGGAGSTTGDGNAGTQPGGGGGGAGSNDTTQRTGGDGGAGQVIVTEFF